MNTYEVKKMGVTLYMGSSLTDAEDSYKKANSFETYLFRITNSKKHMLKRK